MCIENKKIIGVTSEKTGKITVDNKELFVEKLKSSFVTDNIDESLLLDFKEGVFDSLQRDEWFYIDLTDENIQAIDNIVKEPRTLLHKEEIISLSHIIYYDTEEETPTRVNIEYLTKKNLCSPQILEAKRNNKYKFVEKNQENLQITGTIRIKYYKDIAKLLFKKHTDLRGFFDISHTYQEATVAEVNDFKEYLVINFTRNFKVGARNNEKIKMILENKEDYLTDSSKQAALKAYAEKYHINVYNADNILDIKDNKELTEVLDLLLENYNEDPISGDQILIKSKTPR